jgi:cytochrome c oxidase subunit 4
MEMTTHTAPAPATAVEHGHSHHSHRPLYYKIFAILMVLLVATVGAAWFDLGELNLIAALGIAVVKGALIVLFFMHFKESDHLTWIVGIATVAWFLILIFLTLNDYASRDLISSMPGK